MYAQTGRQILTKFAAMTTDRAGADSRKLGVATTDYFARGRPEAELPEVQYIGDGERYCDEIEPDYAADMSNMADNFGGPWRAVAWRKVKIGAKI